MLVDKEDCGTVKGGVALKLAWMQHVCNNKNELDIDTHENFYTDNSSSKHLELYSVMAEHDNARFPLSYCL